MMRKPQEIEDEEHEQILERVAAIDVAKASGMVCTRVPHPSRPGRRRDQGVGGGGHHERDHGAGRRSWRARGSRGSPSESTSDYWRIWFYLLEAAGPGRAAGQRPRRQERPGPAEDRQAGRGLAGQADRAGHAAALVRAARRDPAAARLHPAAGRPDPGAHPALAAAGEAAGGRPDQGVDAWPAHLDTCRSGTCWRR